MRSHLNDNNPEQACKAPPHVSRVNNSHSTRKEPSLLSTIVYVNNNASSGTVSDITLDIDDTTESPQTVQQQQLPVLTPTIIRRPSIAVPIRSSSFGWVHNPWNKSNTANQNYDILGEDYDSRYNSVLKSSSSSSVARDKYSTNATTEERREKHESTQMDVTTLMERRADETEDLNVVDSCTDEADMSTQALTTQSAVRTNDEDITNETTALLLGSSEHANSSGRKLWDIMRDRTDSILLQSQEWSSHHAPSSNVEESTQQRVERHKLQALNEIRKSVGIGARLCMLVIATYLGVGVIAYSLVFEKFTVLDSLYFSVVTLCTVGYGDLQPTNEMSRVFTCIYAIGGSALLGIVLGVVGSNLIDAEVRAATRARDMKQYQVLSVFKENQDVATDENKVVEEKDEESSEEGKTWFLSHGQRYYLLPAAFVLSILAFVLSRESGWSFIDTIYFCVTTATTTGFGDFLPPTPVARFLAIFLIPLAVFIMAGWVAMSANAIIERRQATFRKSFQSKDLTIRDFEIMDTNRDGKIDRAEFLEFMLLAMVKVDQRILDELRSQFNRLDIEGTGCLDWEDMKALAKRRLRCGRRKLELASYKRKLLQVKPKRQSLFQTATALMKANASMKVNDSISTSSTHEKVPW